MSQPTDNVSKIEGTFSVAPGAKFAIVASRFNAFIVERLVEGALDALRRHAVPADAVSVVWVPGSWELPLVCKKLTEAGKYSALVALGTIIRGATPHFDHVAAQAARGIAQVSLESGVPIGFGVLTTDSIEQAVERAGTKAGNKGYDAAMVAIEMASLCGVLDGQRG